MRPQNRHLKPWKPGQSGNPKGSRPKAKSLREDIGRVFERWNMTSVFARLEVDWELLQAIGEKTKQLKNAS